MAASHASQGFSQKQFDANHVANAVAESVKYMYCTYSYYHRIMSVSCTLSRTNKNISVYRATV